ncbi:MAG: aminotransferase class V-fold PLP-dependent enzyme [Clavibacter sp.]|nr:aminotransferase class V-fold PLP-dependent enzyme [Clavibacter sp.]
MVYLDNTATSQTPREVVDAIVDGYTRTKANVHRGVHTLSQEATERKEQSRRRVAAYINAASEREVIFTRGTTEALNLVAASFGPMVLRPGSELILTVMEHHANIVPWQLLQRRIPFEIKVVPIREDGSLDLDVYRSLFSEHTALVSVCHASNVLGTVNPVAEMIAEAHARGVPVVIDGAQSVPHMAVDVRALDAGLAHLAALLGVDPATPGTGAAGGTAAGLVAWGAVVGSGSAGVADAIGLAGLLADADVVITGEGRFDAQSRTGKVASHVLDVARAHGTAAILVAGSVAAPTVGFAAAVSLTDLAGSADSARADAVTWLEHAAEDVARGRAWRG